MLVQIYNNYPHEKIEDRARGSCAAALDQAHSSSRQACEERDSCFNIHSAPFLLCVTTPAFGTTSVHLSARHTCSSGQTHVLFALTH